MLPRTILRSELVRHIEGLGLLVEELREWARRQEQELAQRAMALARSEGILAERQRELEAALREMQEQRLELAGLAQQLQAERAALEARREILRQQEEALAARAALLAEREELLRERESRAGSAGGRRPADGGAPRMRVVDTPVPPPRGAESSPGDGTAGPQPDTRAQAGGEDAVPAGPTPEAVLARVIGPLGDIQVVEAKVRWGEGAAETS
ncbi:coiled-coil domain-containing protein [Caldinitratiruptor microaerophilus]|uniref:Uncharacterized protein n=1 Tax=Caldinitratiruptor microaerophilus TaxID=671077 RepID=A0AA35CJ95_9FIRM|nr:hypothetical protein [Caldinitratiruptor microaerophilus]BDG60285.1 hypothetical protein caldi_13750 [Caldinitratiruptor microaerophilus]